MVAEKEISVGRARVAIVFPLCRAQQSPNVETENDTDDP